MNMNKRNLLKNILFSALIASSVLCFNACSHGGEDNMVHLESNSSSVTETKPTETKPTETSTPKPTAVPKKDIVPKKTYYGDLNISGMSRQDAIEAANDYLEELIGNTTVTVIFSDASLEISGSDAKISSSNVEEEINDCVDNKTSKNITPSFTLEDDSTITDEITSFAQQYNIEAKNATVGNYDSYYGTFTFEEGKSGKVINVKKTVAAVLKQLNVGISANVEASTNKVEPTVTAENLESRFTMLSSYSTVSTNTDAGNHNMALAFSYIDGLVMQPGDVFSFNNTVGDSTTAESGFQPAYGILHGDLVPMYGGGICQASSTLYIACLYAGLNVDYRTCHSRPSTYVPIGLDATVSYNDLDFIFTNSLEYPIYIEAYMSGYTLTCNIYGVQPEGWDYIEVNSWQTETIPVPQGVDWYTDYTLAQGDIQYKFDGYQGYRAEAERVYYKDGYELKREALTSSYYAPAASTYAVGPNTDVSYLQAMNQQATTNYYNDNNNDFNWDDEPEYNFDNNYDDGGYDDNYDYGYDDSYYGEEIYG